MLRRMDDHEQRLAEIITDGVSGASELTARASALLRDWALAAGCEAAVAAAARIRRAHPSMAQLINLTCDVEALGGDTERLLAFLADADAGRKEREMGAVRHAAAAVGDCARVLTLSRSRLVEMMLHALPRQPAVVIGESRPRREGATQARRLAAAGFPTTLVVDAALPALVEPGDVAVIGCDALTRGGVINKIGSYPLALACRERGVRLIALCPSDKFLAADRAAMFAIGERPATELGADLDPRLRVINRYFETIPLALFSLIIGENGTFKNEK